MANFKGFKQVLASDYAGFSADDKKGYLWFVRENAESEKGAIYFGSRLYADVTDVDLNGFYTKEEVDNALAGKADADVVTTVNGLATLVEEVMGLIGIEMPNDKLELVLGESFEGVETVVAALELLATKLAEHEAAAEAKFAAVEEKISTLVINTVEKEGTTFVQLKSGEDVISEFDAAQFVVDGMLEDAQLDGNYLVLTFNTDDKQEIRVDLSTMIKSYVFNESQFIVEGTNVSLKEEYIQGLVAAAQSGLTVVEGDGIKVNYGTDENGAVVTVSANVAENVEGNFLAVSKDGLYAVILIEGNDVEE